MDTQVCILYTDETESVVDHGSLYLHVHVLFGILNVLLDLWSDVETQLLRHVKRDHGGADHL